MKQDLICKLLAAVILSGLTVPIEASFVRISYGESLHQFGELRTASAQSPVLIFLHGGCWLSQYNLNQTNAIMSAFTASGITTWSLEYRSIGNGGGWPETFLDVAHGVDHLRVIADRYPLDLDRVIVAGHSAGGQLALWAAARPNLSPDSPLYKPDPLPVRGVLALAPAPMLGVLHKRAVCDHVVDKLMGGSPRRYRDRYDQVDLARIAPSAPQLLLIGNKDRAWAWVGRRYFQLAMRRGDAVQLLELPEAGHFALINPNSSAWPVVLQSARSLLQLDTGTPVPASAGIQGAQVRPISKGEQ